MHHLKEMAVELIGVYAGFEVLKESVTEWRQHSEAVARLTQMYQNNQGTVHESLEQMKEIAEKQENLTGIHSENTMAAEANLMKYRDLKLSYEELIPVAADFAKVQGTDVADAANLMGRALTHPEKAMRLLMQAGIALDQNQINVLAQMEKTGGGAKAQGMLFDLLKDKFHGVAQAMYESDPLNKLDIGFKQVKESIGQLISEGLAVIVPYLVEMMEVVKESVKWLREHTDVIKAVGIAVGIAATAWLLYNSYVKLSAWWTGLSTIAIIANTLATEGLSAAMVALDIAMDANPVRLIIVAIAALSVAFYEAYEHCETFRRIVGTLWAGLKDLGIAVWDWLIIPFKIAYHTIASVWDALTGDVAGAKSHISKIGEAYKDVFDDIKNGITDVQNAWGADYSKSKTTDPNKKLGESKKGLAGGALTDIMPGSQSDKVSGTKQVIINVSINKNIYLNMK